MSQPGIIRVVADHREVSAPVVDVFRALPGIELTMASLSIGDYDINGHCLFERKTLPDFVESIIDGRLFSQAQRLMKSGRVVALILEGRAADLANTEMRREAIQGAIISLCLIYGLPVLRSFCPEETARLMLYAADQLKRCHNGGRLIHGKRPKTRRRLQLRVLQSLPGIGAHRAGELLDQFGSVEAVMNATAEELKRIEGIGVKTADRIRWVLQESE